MSQAYPDPGSSMFETLKSPIANFGPSAKALEDSLANEGRAAKVELREVVVRTYDLGDDEQRQQYVYDMELLLIGVANKTHVMLAKEPLRFIDGAAPRYVAHMQWAEFHLCEAPLTTAPTLEQKKSREE